jgi:hypothetical protein
MNAFVVMWSLNPNPAIAVFTARTEPTLAHQFRQEIPVAASNYQLNARVLPTEFAKPVALYS